MCVGTAWTVYGDTDTADQDNGVIEEAVEPQPVNLGPATENSTCGSTEEGAVQIEGVCAEEISEDAQAAPVNYHRGNWFWLGVPETGGTKALPAIPGGSEKLEQLRLLRPLPPGPVVAILRD